MKKSNCFLLVYGSETGQAQAIAEQIAEKSAEFGLQANLHCLEETDKGFNIKEETCMVMVTSTTGDGDAPDNAAKFLRRIKKRTLPSDYLSHLHYTVLGLGDTNYNNFCKCPRDMDSRLEQLGAKRFYPTGLADDGVGLEVVIDPWLEGLYPALREFLGLSSTSNNDSSFKEVSLSERVGAIAIPTDNGPKDNLQKIISSEKSFEIQSDQIHVENDNVDSVEKSLADLDLNEVRKECEVESEKMLIFNSSNEGQPSSPGDDDKRGSQINEEFSSGRETRCVRIDIVKEGVCEKLTIRDTSPALVDKDLTVPLLPSEYLKADYSDTALETVNLSHQNDCKLPSSASDIVHARVSHARVLTQPGAVKKTLWLRLDVKDKGIKYSPGDSISVICENNGSEVQLLLERLGVAALADQKMSLSLIPETKKRRAAVPPHIHPTTTLRHVLKTCVNLRDPPSKAFLRALVDHTTNEEEKRRLQELCSKEGVEEYAQFIREKCVSLLDVLYAFPSCQPTVERILEFLPRLLPRPYSICSCQETNPHSLEIVFNVVEIPGDVVDGHYYHRRGVCTGWLDDITVALQNTGSCDGTEDIKIPIFFRTNQHFQPPNNLSKPLIMIGPGTGVAPFIGFLQQRALLKSKGEKDDELGETWLFSGCRNKDKDYLFGEELNGFAASGVLTRLCASFSRDQDSCHRYVQDYMRSESSGLAHLVVDHEALVYVCGDAKNMAKDVNSAFLEILISEKGFSQDEANTFMMKKRLHKSYLEDVWT